MNGLRVFDDTAHVEYVDSRSGSFHRVPVVRSEAVSVRLA